MMTAAVLLMPVLMTAATLVAGARLQAFPNRDDLWRLPRRSSALGHPR